MESTFVLNLFAIPVLLTCILFLLLFAISFRKENNQGERFFSYLMLASFLYAFFYGLELSSGTDEAIIFFFKMEFLGGVYIAPFLLLFVLKYSDQAKYINRVNMGLVFGVATLLLLMVLTNDYHHLFFHELSASQHQYFKGIAPVKAPLFWFYGAFNSLLIIISNIILVRMLSSIPKIYSTQVTIMLLGTLVPWISYLIAIFGKSPFNVDPITFTMAFSSLLLFWGLYRSRILRASPVAFKTIFSNLSDGVIIFDKHKKIIAINDEADKQLTLFGITERKELIKIIEDLPEVKPLFAGKGSNTYTEVPNSKGEILEISLKTVRPEKDSDIFSYLTFRDISEQKESEKMLKQKENKLQQINFTLLRSEKMLTSIAFATKELLSNPDFTTATQKAITLLGDGAGADRAYLFESSKDEEGNYYISQRFEWSAMGVPPEIDNPNLQNIPLGIFGEEAFSKFLKNQYYQAIISEIKEDAIREFLQFQGIKSILMIPVFVEREFWGLVGFDDCSNEKEWSEAETALLVSFADSIANGVERKNLEQSLRHSMEKAREASVAKSEFLANMSHEIRTPLNGVIGFSDLLMKTSLHEDQKEYVKSIIQSGNLLLNLLNDILDFSKIEAGKLELSPSKVNLSELAKESIKLIKPTADEKGLKLSISMDPELPNYVMADITRLKQILINLLSNSAKFTHEGEISLSIEMHNTDRADSLPEFVFAVKDTGIGISEEKKNIIFDAFAQEDTSTTRKYGGTGLGLTICNKLLELMDSKLELDTEVGKGSNFFFKVKLQVADHEEKTKEEQIKKENPQTLDKPKNEADQDKQHRILLVDDNPVNMLLAKTIVKNLLPKAIISEAKNGREAVEIFGSLKPELVFMDIQMPEMSGYEATQAIRNLENGNKRVPIVALTAGTVKGEYERCLEIGMDEYLSKPVVVSDIQRMIEKFLGTPKATKNKAILSRFEEFRSADPVFFKELLEVSRTNLGKLRDDLVKHLESGETKLVKQTGHAIKGVGLNLDLSELSEKATKVEIITDLAAGDALETIEQLNQEIIKILESLDNEISKL